MQANIKTKNEKNLKVKVLVDSGCTYIEIDEQLVKDKRIQTKPINFSFEVFNINRTNNGEMTRVVSQISYSLVVILKLNSVPEVQYKDVMMTDDEKYQQE